MSRPTILLVDDDSTNLSALTSCLPADDFRIVAAKSGEAALRIARKAEPDLVILDIMMPGIDGFETCRRLRDFTAAPVIFLSASDRPDDKVRGFKVGGVDFMVKPVVPEEVSVRVETHLRARQLAEELRHKNVALERELSIARQLLQDARRRDEGFLKGDSRIARELRRTLAQHSVSRHPILLECPPGGGAEAVARSIHAQGLGRAGRPFLIFDATLQHGANARAESVFSQPGSSYRLAAGGSFFIDFLSELPLASQRDLLWLMQGEPADEGLETRPRIIAAIRGGLHDSFKRGRLLPELYEAFAGGVVRIPALAERSEDIPLLIQDVVDTQARRLGRPIYGLTAQSLEMAKTYSWPGNYRELRSLIERLAIITRGGLIDIPEEQLRTDGVNGYRLISKLGEGGMGVIWQAEHRMLSRPAAIKIIRQNFEDEDERNDFLARFEREARATANLRCPHTVTLFEYGVTLEGAPFYVMELLDGLDLDQLVERYGAIHPGRACRLLGQACLSLAEAHDAGIIHRDIKPGNIALCRIGAQYDFVKVLDFGLVKNTNAGRHQRTTNPNFLVGTPGFMAPEYVVDGHNDARSDLYSLAAVGYFLISGRYHLDGETSMQLLMKQSAEDPPLLSSVCPGVILKDLDDFFAACLSRDPGQRPATALEFAEQLEAISARLPWTSRQAEYWWSTFEPRGAEDSSWSYPSSIGLDTTRVDTDGMEPIGD